MATSPTVTITVPSALVDHLADTEDTLIRPLLANGRSLSGGGIRVTATAADHYEILDACWVLGPGEGIDNEPYERAAYARYARKIATATLRMRRAA